MILTAAEIADLTGKLRRTAQVRVLDALAVPYRLRPDGSIVIFKAHIYHAPTQDRSAPPSLRLP